MKIQGEVIGYRGFRVTGPPEGPRLISAGLGEYVWKPGVNEATCPGYDLTSVGAGMLIPVVGEEDPAPSTPEPSHQAPDSDCGCGFYCRHTPDSLRSDEEIVLGAVKCWGKRLQIHPTGFRAQYAEIVAIVIPERIRAFNPEGTQTLEAIAHHYRVPAVNLVDLEQTAREHGDPVPEECYPEPEKPTLSEDMARTTGGAPPIYLPPGVHQIWQPMNVANAPVPAAWASFFDDIQPEPFWFERFLPRWLRNEGRWPRSEYAVELGFRLLLSFIVLFAVFALFMAIKETI